MCACVWRPKVHRHLLNDSLPSFRHGAFHWAWALPIGCSGWPGSPSLEVYLSHICPILVAQNHSWLDVAGGSLLGGGDSPQGGGCLASPFLLDDVPMGKLLCSCCNELG